MSIVIRRHAAGKIVVWVLLRAGCWPLGPDVAVVAPLAHAWRAVLVLPRRALLTDAAHLLALSRHVPPALSFRPEGRGE